MPGPMTEGLGERWYFPRRIFYKVYPCCGAMQNSLAHFHKIIMENRLEPDDIEEVQVTLNPLAELPLWRTTQIATHVEAQFSVPYVFAVMAHRTEIGPSWQTEETYRDPRIIQFMRKVKVFTNMAGHSGERPDVEVLVYGGGKRKVYSGKGLALRGNMTDVELMEKFKRNARNILDDERITIAANCVQRLEDLSDISELVRSTSR